MSPGFRVRSESLLLHIKGTVTVFEVARQETPQELLFLILWLSRRDGCHLQIFPKENPYPFNQCLSLFFSVLLSTCRSWELRPLMLLKTVWTTGRWGDISDRYSRQESQCLTLACWPQCLPQRGCSLLWPWWEHEGPGETVPMFCHLSVELNNHLIYRGSVTEVVNKGVCNLSQVILRDLGQEAEAWWSRNC